MAGTEKARSEEDSPCPIAENHDDQAVDESSDVDGDFATQQKMLSQKRRAAKDSPESRLQQALPFITKFAPNIRPLTISDLPSVIALEKAAFPNPEHQASPEKASRHTSLHHRPTPTNTPSPIQLEYRLTVAPELSLGVFLTVIPSQAQNLGIETLPTAQPVETGRADGAVSVLLAHVVSTRCRGDVVTDADMAYPADWRTRGGRTAPDAGHQEGGRTVGLHSLAVLPRLQRCGIGQMIVKAFLDQMKTSGLVDRVALLCQDVSSPRARGKEWGVVS
jgi:GNAT superfamily N-acetyltransferase